MKKVSFFLIFAFTLTIIFCGCRPDYNWTTVYDPATGEHKRVSFDEAYPERVMTPEEVEKENARIDAEGYR